MKHTLRTQHFGFALTTTVALAFALILSTVEPGKAAEQANCAVTAGTNAGHKFATLKCARKSDPNNYVIRSTVWESKDKKGYRDLARAAGRRFTCSIEKERTSTRSRVQTTYYKLLSCK